MRRLRCFSDSKSIKEHIRSNNDRIVSFRKMMFMFFKNIRPLVDFSRNT